MSEELHNDILIDGVLDDPFSLQLAFESLKDLSEMCGESGVELFTSSELLSLASQVMRDDSINPPEEVF